MIAWCCRSLSSAIKKIAIKLYLCKKQDCISNPKSKVFNIHKLDLPFDVHKLSLLLIKQMTLLNLLIAYVHFDI